MYLWVLSSITGFAKGFISSLKKEINKHSVSTPEVDLVIKTIIKIVNYIQTNELYHRKFKSLWDK